MPAMTDQSNGPRRNRPHRQSIRASPAFATYFLNTFVTKFGMSARRQLGEMTIKLGLELSFHWREIADDVIVRDIAHHGRIATSAPRSCASM